MLVYDEKQVKNRFNLKPEQLADLRALAGDSSDNITGVPGIGEVTAKKLLSQHGRLEDLLRNLASLPAKWRNPLTEHREEAIEFKMRASIRTDLELDVDWSKCCFAGIPVERVGEIYSRTELDKYLEALPQSGSPGALSEEQPVEVLALDGKKAKAGLKKYLESVTDELGILFLGAGNDLVALALSVPGQVPMVVRVGSDSVSLKEALKLLQPIFNAPDKKIHTHNLRGLLMTADGAGLTFKADVLDIGVASHLLDAREGNPWLDEVARRFGYDIPGEGELLGHGEGYRKISDVPLDELADWAARRVRVVNQLGNSLKVELQSHGLLDQYLNVEYPMIQIYSGMERDHVPVDGEVLDGFLAQVETLLKELEAAIYEEAGQKFDLRDQKELAEVLFDKMAIAVTARPKNGALIGLDILNQIAEQNPIGALLRDHRELSALVVSFSRARERFERPRSGWLRRVAQFNVSNSERLLWMGPVSVGGAAATFNRLLSEVDGLPNADQRQQFRTHLLSALRTEKKTNVLLGVSVNQFQLRLAAHLSEDPALQKAFIRSEDVEVQLLNKLVAEDERCDSSDARQDLVDTLLGSIGEHRLARRTGITPADAGARIENLMERFFASYQKMETFFTGELDKVKERGWVTSLAGRRRSVPEMSSRNSDIRGTAERVARNAAVQNSAADLIKKFLVELHPQLDSSELPARLVAQVRDELIFEVPKKSLEPVASKLMSALEESMKLSVPVVAEARWARNWAETEPVRLETSAARS
jgi:DNA polymerase-1